MFSHSRATVLWSAPHSLQAVVEAVRVHTRTKRAEASKAPALTIYAVTGWLGQGDVVRLHALLAAGRLVGDLGTLFERLKTAACYPAVMNEEVFATLVRGDKAVAFIVVEPLNRSLGHVLEPTFLVPGAPPQ